MRWRSLPAAFVLAYEAIDGRSLDRLDPGDGRAPIGDDESPEPPRVPNQRACLLVQFAQADLFHVSHCDTLPPL